MHIEITEKKPEGWDANLDSCAEQVSLTHSSFWAELLAQKNGSLPRYVQCHSDGNLAAQALFLLQTPYSPKISGKTCFKNLVAHGGPAILIPGKRQEAITAILKAALELRAKNKSRSILISLPPLSELNQDISHFQKSGFAPMKWGTIMVDLTMDEDELFRSFKHAARKCINKCRKMGIEIVETCDYDHFISEYFPVLVSKSGSENVKPLKAAFTLDKNNYYHRYVARTQDGEPLACLGFYQFNGIATEIASALSPRAMEMKIPAQDYLHWHLFLEAKRLGCRLFDLAGVNPDPQTPKEKGIRRFKEKWNGEYIGYYRHKYQVFSAREKGSALLRKLLNR